MPGSTHSTACLGPLAGAQARLKRQMSAGHALWARALGHRAQPLLLKKQRGQDSNGPQVPQPAPPAPNRGQVPQKAAQGDRLSEPRDAGPWGGGALTPVLKQLQASSAPSQS